MIVSFPDLLQENAALSDEITNCLEIYVTSTDNVYDILYKLFPNDYFQVLPCINVKERLPIFAPEEALHTLKTSLAVFDIGISTKKATVLVMGSGYSVLDINKLQRLLM
ncbi:hypothetical protein BD770DRAFT_414165 [Pilaira anomala]|nr:hypothetical protein BD770DRAFT_414165 [Pilaira anomala]